MRVNFAMDDELVDLALRELVKDHKPRDVRELRGGVTARSTIDHPHSARQYRARPSASSRRSRLRQYGPRVVTELKLAWGESGAESSEADGSLLTA